jgi:cytochrome c peroxidase
MLCLVLFLKMVMKKQTTILLLASTLVLLLIFSFHKDDKSTSYSTYYASEVINFINQQQILINQIEQTKLDEQGVNKIKEEIYKTRSSLKAIDFWLRYLEPVAYKKINGPLPAEWETEVFEKFEKPYRRIGAGLTLAALYLDEETIYKDSLAKLITESLKVSRNYLEDSVTKKLIPFDHFFYCNRLFLLNLAAIYTTGFECPESSKIIPELKGMLQSVGAIYIQYNKSFPEKSIPNDYFSLYEKATRYVNSQPLDASAFNHFEFIKEYVNPLFAINQDLIRKYDARSISFIDYSLNQNCTSIFSKNLYHGQNTKGVYLRIYDEVTLKEIEEVGKTLFHDPLLSGNNQRSCASCHKVNNAFTDTVLTTAFAFDKKAFLPRNTPSLINADFNHLLMLDGKHISLHNQTKDVLTNPTEMGSNEKELLKKVLSCKEYNMTFKKLLKRLPEQKEIDVEHITSAIVYYYSRFSNYYAPFDRAMSKTGTLSESATRGFNLFMSKAQCATCHFVPQFNGVKPPYVGSEFEVLGVPADTLYAALSKDDGRYRINSAKETFKAFRTGTIRNADRTAPYMHNGVFKTMTQVIEFYNTGGGAGHGLKVDNQTLSSDSLHLSEGEKKDLLSFISSLNEDLPINSKPILLPVSKYKNLNKRVPGGEY